ncbi:aminotransferase class V-fold PLP-dependent enzyme [Amphibacillus marinus]|nr:aminotransferase class V-fold PLP-dependent enzyme [Amphibacillus marinus]
MSKTSNLEKHFDDFRTQTIGANHYFTTKYGTFPLLYADWTASGRLYHPIEDKLSNIIGPWIGNTHTDHNTTSSIITEVYHHAKKVIKAHVNACEDDLVIATGAGTTAALNKLQRLLGIRVPAALTNTLTITEQERPIILTSLMEHHSNYLSWKETIGNVEVVQLSTEHQIDLNHLEQLLKKYQDRRMKIGAFTACSNVTGIKTNFHAAAKLMHQYGGKCFIDYAASAPYEEIDMHVDELDYFDGIAFSPHKFLGGPGSSGLLIVNKSCLSSAIPDQPGGGTVLYTNKWGKYKYHYDPETREDGGTPAIMQTIKAALTLDLKQEMEPALIAQREQEILTEFLPKLAKINGVTILGYPNKEARLGIISFTIQNMHHHLIALLLNDRFGIQVRSGCSCAGPYGHSLLKLSKNYSNKMIKKILAGDQSYRPGWVRVSLHPTIRDDELAYLLFAIEQVTIHYFQWQADYSYDKATDRFQARSAGSTPSIVPLLFND